MEFFGDIETTNTLELLMLLCVFSQKVVGKMCEFAPKVGRKMC
jgi:hypothetical protein